MELGTLEIALLVLAALVAGTVDAIAGGGGLITVPALLAAGLPAHHALGTNKGQSVFGAIAALWRYQRGGLVDRDRAKVSFPMGLLGSAAGASLVLLLRPETLRPLVLILLVCVAVFLALHRRRDTPRPARPPHHALAITATLALVIGTYDGFFGPGTGTFLIVGLVGLLGLTLPQATADAKVVNFASNLAAVAIFGWRGLILWQVALPMAAAQFVGGWFGAHLAVRGGARLIRVMVLLVVSALVAKLGFDVYAER